MADLSYEKIIEKAWHDEKFKQLLLEDPEAALSSIGLSCPSGQKIVVVEDTPDTLHLVIPVPQKSAKSSECHPMLDCGPVAGTR